MNQEIENYRVNLCKKYNVPYKNFHSWIKYVSNAKENNMEIEEYLKYISPEEKEKRNKENEQKIEKEREDLCIKYNMPYKNYHSWILYQRRAKKLNLTIEEYFKYLQNKKENNKIKKDNKKKQRDSKIKLKEQENNNKREIIEKYGFEYIDGRTYANYLRDARKNNRTLEEHLKILRNDIDQKEKLEKEIKQFCYNNNIDRANFSATLANARGNGFNSEDPIKDFINYKKFLEEKEINKINELNDFQNKKDNLMISLDLKPEDWKGELVSARKRGFNTDNPFRDIINNRGILKFCSCCNKETPHKLDENDNLYCLNCSGEYTFCEHCNEWEDINYYNTPYHWISDCEFFKLRIWKKENINIFNFLSKNIIGFEKLLNNKIYCGIYRWYIDNIPYYYGKSENIYRRASEHFINIVEDPLYWLNIFDEIKNNNHILEIKFNEYPENELDYWEKYWILKELPMSQKCTNDNNFDHIIPLNQRDYTIDNLKEKYEEKLINFKEERRENKI